MKQFILTLLLFLCYTTVIAPAEGTKCLTILQPEPPIYRYIGVSEINKLLIKYKVHHRDIVMAQILLETGNLTSELFKTNCNLFGMRHPIMRQTTSLGNNLNHAYYMNYEDCVADYALWQRLNYHPKEDYYYFLSRIGYASDPYYIRKLKMLKI
jgi:flagellum-specific peptidoglycan hydrolase FlgJ